MKRRLYMLCLYVSDVDMLKILSNCLPYCLSTYMLGLNHSQQLIGSCNLGLITSRHHSTPPRIHMYSTIIAALFIERYESSATNIIKVIIKEEASNRRRLNQQNKVSELTPWKAHSCGFDSLLKTLRYESDKKNCISYAYGGSSHGTA
uniref:Uncharacterized protein n=1 Tax=Glossina pallidipes TaxID=7398 RepID=A0A1B0AHT6_GLOPL